MPQELPRPLPHKLTRQQVSDAMVQAVNILPALTLTEEDLGKALGHVAWRATEIGAHLRASHDCDGAGQELRLGYKLFEQGAAAAAGELCSPNYPPSFEGRSYDSFAVQRSQPLLEYGGETVAFALRGGGDVAFVTREGVAWHRRPQCAAAYEAAVATFRCGFGAELLARLRLALAVEAVVRVLVTHEGAAWRPPCGPRLPHSGWSVSSLDPDFVGRAALGAYVRLTDDSTQRVNDMVSTLHQGAFDPVQGITFAVRVGPNGEDSVVVCSGAAEVERAPFGIRVRVRDTGFAFDLHPLLFAGLGFEPVPGGPTVVPRQLSLIPKHPTYPRLRRATTTPPIQQ